MFLTCATLVLLMSAEHVSSTVIANRTCYSVSDIVFAVDTTSSESRQDFDFLKSEVKKIAKIFASKSHVRFALVSVATTASVLLEFDSLNSLSGLLSAVDKLSFSVGTADISEGMKIAADQLFRARQKAFKNLILVKDKRSVEAVAHEEKALSRIKSEASRLKNGSTIISVVGIGGFWSRAEVEAIYGPNYLLLKTIEKAVASLKTLNGRLCEECSLTGSKSKDRQGLCYGSLRLEFYSRSFKVDSIKGIQICRKELTRQLESCRDENQRCQSFIGEKSVGTCDKATGKVQVDITMDYFVIKDQACRKKTKSTLVPCSSVNVCPHQSDIIFVLDRSGTVNGYFPMLTSAVVELVKQLNIGRDNVMVGVLSFNDKVQTEVRLGEVDDKNRLLDKIRSIDNLTEATTETHLALAEARTMFANSKRIWASKLVILMTDGESGDQFRTLRESILLKNEGVDLYVVGLADSDEVELKAMTAPDTTETLYILKDFSELKPWSEKFSMTMCSRLSPPDDDLCKNNVLLQSITDCHKGVRYVVTTSYVAASSGPNTCVKIRKFTKSSECGIKCLSPVDGNEYLNGHIWESLCFTFKCADGIPKVMQSTCMASDGSCVYGNSPTFSCLDENLIERSDCRCIVDGTVGTLTIDRDTL